MREKKTQGYQLIVISLLALAFPISAGANEQTAASSPTINWGAITEQLDQTVAQVAERIHVAPATSSRQDRLKSTALAYQGVPYVYGGTSPAGFDCSGFTSYVYQEALGQTIGRTTYAQIASGRQIALDLAQPGDVLVFFGGAHVGLYLGSGQFIHAPVPGDVVRISSLSEMPCDQVLRFDDESLKK